MEEKRTTQYEEKNAGKGTREQRKDKKGQGYKQGISDKAML